MTGAPAGPRTRRLFDVEFACVDLSEVVSRIQRAIETGSGGTVVTANVDHIVRLRQDSAFREAYAAAWLRVADGAPVVWASALLGARLPGRVTGADLLPAVCEAGARERWRLYLLGGLDDAASLAAQRLAVRFPGVEIAGAESPSARFGAGSAESEAVVARIGATRPDILFVGLGSPLQELWVAREGARLGAKVVICCGAAIDFAAGRRRRAPRWMQRAGLEWMWRLMLEPRRLWRRYLIRDLAFAGIVAREWRRRRSADP